MDVEQKGKLIFFAYLVLGLPVVWLHVRQQKMVQSMKTIQSPNVSGLVVYTLAVMWPILLLSIGLTYLQRKKPPAKPAYKPDAATKRVP